MGRTHVTLVTQTNDVSCGPAALKHAFAIFGVKKSLTTLQSLCKTNRNGTSTANLISAITKLGYSVLAIENATLRHVIGSLRYPPNKPRAVIVSYLYGSDDASEKFRDTGHWATVSSYSASDGKIIIFDSLYGKKKSYKWHDFLRIWKDYDYVRKPVQGRKKQFKLVRMWQHRLLLVVAKDVEDLPAFSIQSAKIISP